LESTSSRDGRNPSTSQTAHQALVVHRSLQSTIDICLGHSACTPWQNCMKFSSFEHRPPSYSERPHGKCPSDAEESHHVLQGPTVVSGASSDSSRNPNSL
jgi:hypothetical protein